MDIRRVIIGISVWIGIIIYNPMISYAIDLNQFDFSDYKVDVENLGSFNGSMVRDLRTSGANNSLFSLNINPFGGNPGTLTGYSIKYRYAYYIPDDKDYFFLYHTSANGNSYDEITGFSSYYGYRKNNKDEYVVVIDQVSGILYKDKNKYSLVYTNIPIFKDRDKMRNYLINGIYDVSDIVNSEYVDNPDSGGDNLGFIIPSYFTNGNSALSIADRTNETITWQEKSTSGFDVTQSGVNVEFAIRDKSLVVMKPNAVNDLGTWVTNWLDKYVYPQGNDALALANGGAIKAQSYGKMITAGTVSGSSRRFYFRALHDVYNDTNKNNDPQTYLYTQNYLNGGLTWYESCANILSSQNNQLASISWDIYARIINGSQYGDWLKINKHGTPFQEQSNRINGGVTKDRVRIPSVSGGNTNDGDYTPYNPTDTFTDAPDDVPYNPLVTDDEEEEDYYDGFLPTGTNDGSNDSSGDTIIYNNYIYNYDNRSWVTNNYNNQDVNDMQESLNIFKMFPLLFGLFTSLFGAFLPAWALTGISILIPLIVVALVFKTVKSVIPFI